MYVKNENKIVKIVKTKNCKKPDFFYQNRKCFQNPNAQLQIQPQIFTQKHFWKQFQKINFAFWPDPGVPDPKLFYLFSGSNMNFR